MCSALQRSLFDLLKNDLKLAFLGLNKLGQTNNNLFIFIFLSWKYSIWTFKIFIDHQFLTWVMENMSINKLEVWFFIKLTKNTTITKSQILSWNISKITVIIFFSNLDTLSIHKVSTFFVKSPFYFSIAFRLPNNCDV